MQQPIDSDIKSDVTKERFGLNYCTITGAVLPKNFETPDSFNDKDGLLIGNDVTVIQIESDKITIEGDVDFIGNITVNGDLDVDGDIDATGTINAVVDIKTGTGLPGTNVSLRTHVHATTGPPPAPTAPPTPT